MFKAGTGIVTLRANTKPLQGVASKVGAAFGGLGAAIASPMGLAAAAVGLLTVGLRKAIAAARIQQDAEAKLAAVLKATGNASGFTADQLFKQAAALQKVTTFGDETIINTQALLATFKNIKGDAFIGATKAALDMSIVMGQDLKSSAIQVGKALNDPIKGVTALTRVGVSFTEQQKEQIKVMQESGDLAGAQAVIQKELASEFGGAAEAASKTLGGALTQLGNIFGDLLEPIGDALGPALVDIGQLFAELGPIILSTVVPAFKAIALAVKILVKPITFFFGLMNKIFGFDKNLELFTKAWDAVGKKIGSIFKWISAQYDKFLKPIIDAINKFRKGIASFFGLDGGDLSKAAVSGVSEAIVEEVKKEVKKKKGNFSLESSAADAARRIQSSAFKSPELVVAKQQLVKMEEQLVQTKIMNDKITNAELLLEFSQRQKVGIVRR